jgi:hypothetical protein
MFSGRFRSRRSNALLQHSGLLCADLDDLAGRLADIRSKLLTSPHLWALFTSPTGDGLKCVFRVPADAEKHKPSFRAVENHVRDLTGIQIDEACSDVGRLCFLSYDPDSYFNEQATELVPLPEGEKSEHIQSPVPSEPEIKIRRDIAVAVLGEIDWQTETQGNCTCPGQHLHTTPTKENHCQVLINGAPTIRCFHSHCKSILKGVNHELRCRIGKAEYAANLQTQRCGQQKNYRSLLRFRAEMLLDE